jgi:hypothetical protein
MLVVGGTGSRHPQVVIEIVRHHGGLDHLREPLDGLAKGLHRIASVLVLVDGHLDHDGLRQADQSPVDHRGIALDDPAILQGAHSRPTGRGRQSNTAGEHLEVGAALENLANKHYAVQAFDLTGVDGLVQTYPGAPRWFKVHVNYHF